MPEMTIKTSDGKIVIESDSNCMNMWDSVLDTAISEMRKIIEARRKDALQNDIWSMDVYDEFLEEIENAKFTFENEFINHESESEQKWFYEAQND